MLEDSDNFYVGILTKMDPVVVGLGAGMMLLCMIGKNTSNTYLMVTLVVVIASSIYLQQCTEDFVPFVRSSQTSARRAQIDAGEGADETLSKDDKKDVSSDSRKDGESADSGEKVETQDKKPPFYFDNLPANPRPYMFTEKQMQERRDEFVYRKTLIHPSSDSRKRVLDEMYRELVESSAKKDPALREQKANSDAEQCTPLRGVRSRDAV